MFNISYRQHHHYCHHHCYSPTYSTTSTEEGFARAKLLGYTIIIRHKRTIISNNNSIRHETGFSRHMLPIFESISELIQYDFKKDLGYGYLFAAEIKFLMKHILVFVTTL